MRNISQLSCEKCKHESSAGADEEEEEEEERKVEQLLCKLARARGPKGELNSRASQRPPASFNAFLWHNIGHIPRGILPVATQEISFDNWRGEKNAQKVESIEDIKLSLLLEKN